MFLGLGMPWLVSAIYFEIVGIDSEWDARYAGYVRKYASFKDMTKPNGGFIVPGDNLGFAVVTFVVCACVAFTTMFLRRLYGGGCAAPAPIAPPPPLLRRPHPHCAAPPPLHHNAQLPPAGVAHAFIPPHLRAYNHAIFDWR